jgi:hypothetical protein
MRHRKLALLATLLGCTTAAANESRHAYYQPSGNAAQVAQVSHCSCGEPVCGCEATGCDASPCEESSCDGGCDASCGCDSGCGIGGGLCALGECDLGEPWTLFGESCGWSAGGWVSIGAHTAADTLFNTRPDEIQLHQAWLFAQKSIDTADGFDIGGRIDYIYGTDGPNTQSFGTGARGWDNSWDSGSDYGHAIPQLYFEAGYGDLSVKMGHFYTIIGWEVVQATGNFFYSHAYTFNNSEPFTHTGALATYNLSEDVTVWGGYVLGWDSGFDDNGDAFLGGVSAQVTEDLKLIYAAVGGRFGEDRFAGNSRGYMHSIVADYAVSDNLQYIFQSDLLDTENNAQAGLVNTIGINQYLIYTLSDCWAVGGRYEWYNNEGIYTAFGDETDIHALTAGVNYRPHANLIVRPEIRWDWVDDTTVLTRDVLEDGDDQQFTFGMDTIITF